MLLHAEVPAGPGTVRKPLETGDRAGIRPPFKNFIKMLFHTCLSSMAGLISGTLAGLAIMLRWGALARVLL